MIKDLLQVVDELSFDDKMKVWLDYMVTHVALNNDRQIIEVNDNNRHWFDAIDYPSLGATYSKAYYHIDIIPFDDFIDKSKCMKEVVYECTGKQIVYTGIYDWYSKFSKRIFA